MLDILLQIGAGLLGAAIGGAAGYFIGKALVNYFDNAKTWFDQAWHSIQRISLAVGILIRRGNRLFKQFVVKTFSDEIESYEDTTDEGVEIEWDALTEEAKKALTEDEFLPVQRYEL